MLTRDEIVFHAQGDDERRLYCGDAGRPVRIIRRVIPLAGCGRR